MTYDYLPRFASTKSFGCLTSTRIEELTNTLKQLTSTLILRMRRAAAHRVIHMSTCVRPLISYSTTEIVCNNRTDRDFTESFRHRYRMIARDDQR